MNPPIETPHQKRLRQIESIIELCGLENERVLRQQLESFSELQIDVTHRLIMRAENGLSQYWRKRAEDAEQVVLSSNITPETTSVS